MKIFSRIFNAKFRRSESVPFFVPSLLRVKLFLCLCLISFPAYAAEKESAFDRVIRTDTLRCGYAVWEPTITKDPNTGKMSGVYYDYMNALGKRLGLKVEWSSEINLATYLEDMNLGKFDVECSGGWPNARRARLAEYTMPIYYTPVYLYTPVKDKRFDNHYETINNPKVRYITLPGDLSEDYRDEFFPKSTNISLPPSSMLADLVMPLATGKADIMFNDAMSARAFMNQNPGKIRRIAGPPVKVMANNLSVAKGEFKLVSMLNEATQELMFDGVIDRIMKKYDLTNDIAWKPAKPYEVTK